MVWQFCLTITLTNTYRGTHPYKHNLIRVYTLITAKRDVKLKTRMTTSISSEAQKIRTSRFKVVFIKIKNRFLGENKHETLFYFE